MSKLNHLTHCQDKRRSVLTLRGRFSTAIRIGRGPNPKNAYLNSAPTAGLKMHLSIHSPPLSNFQDRITIGVENISIHDPCYIIAEAGSNHDQALDKALALVDVAADAGCNAVKFQTFLGPDIASGPATGYTKLPETFAKWGTELRDFYVNCALPKEFHIPIMERSKEKGIAFFSSAFSEWAVDFLHSLGTPALKIASFEIVHLPLIRHAAQTGLPLIISTGLAGLGDIERALEAADKGNCRSLALLHCGSNYPLNASSANLHAMKTIRQAFRVPVGYSDHTLGVAVPTAAAALGAEIIEKHFTTCRDGDGPDHSFALEPSELKAMVYSVHEAQAARGSTRKRRMPEEDAHLLRGRRSIVAARDIVAGERLTLESLKIVRPGIGLEPFYLDLIIGRPIMKDVKIDHPLTWDHLLEKQ